MKCADITAVLVSLKLIVLGRATKSVGKAGKIGCHQENEPWQDALAGQPVDTGQSHMSGLRLWGGHRAGTTAVRVPAGILA